MNVAIIGCGNISSIYFETAQRLHDIDITACADLIVERAQESAEKYSIPKACTPEEVYADPAIDIILNLTIPAAHVEVGRAAIAAGKHVYSEKPLSVDRESAQSLLDDAAKKGVRVGCAPDTFLGAGIQTCRKLIDDGAIGDVIGGTAFLLCPGHERWHPAPEFYYKIGGGPMLDMGPYYFTALVNLLGPVKTISGFAKTTHPTRTITSEPKNGTIIEVETPTHVGGVAEFHNGAVISITTSFDVWAKSVPPIELYGTKGSLRVPDPNKFDGPVEMWHKDTQEWQDVPIKFPYEENSRAVGVADMAKAIIEDRPHRASGELAYHVLDVMCTFVESTEMRTVEVQSTCAQPQPLSESCKEGEIK